MTSKDIIINTDKIYGCASSFRTDANFLMFELAKDNGCDLIKEGRFPREVYKHKYVNKGAFRNNWTYYFHGSECRFDNIITGQIVELICIRIPEFGFLDGYFLFNYMQTTERYRDLANWFKSYTNVWDALDVLADKNILKRIPHANSRRDIIAL